MTQKKRPSKRPGIKKAADIKKPEGLKRSLNEFLADESGFVSKETILKIGLATVSGIGMMGALMEFSSAGHSNHPSHGNGYTLPNSGATDCPTFDATHNNVPSHSSHYSY
jgi:hypothetical protein